MSKQQHYILVTLAVLALLSCQGYGYMSHKLSFIDATLPIAVCYEVARFFYKKGKGEI